jgi:hypothetical protein
MFAAFTAVLTILSTVEFASAAATIPDYELHVNTRSADTRADRNVDAVRDAAMGAAARAAEQAEPEWVEIPARR